MILINDKFFTNEDYASERQELANFMENQRKNGIVFWKNNQNFVIRMKNGKDMTFAFPHDVYVRERKDIKEGIRYEFVKDVVLGTGGFGEVREGYGVMAIKDNEIQFKKYGEMIEDELKKTRVAKVPLQKTVSETAKKDSSQFGTQGTHAVFMEKRGEIDLSLLHPGFTRYDPKQTVRRNLKLSSQEKQQLTVALLNALDKQVIQQGRVHRDIKPDNLRVSLVNGKFVVDIIDFDFNLPNETKNYKAEPHSGYFTAPEAKAGSILLRIAEKPKEISQEWLKEKYSVKGERAIPVSGYLQIGREFWQVQYDKEAKKYDLNPMTVEEPSFNLLEKEGNRPVIATEEQLKRLDEMSGFNSYVLVKPERDIYSMGRVLKELWQEELNSIENKLPINTHEDQKNLDTVNDQQNPKQVEPLDKKASFNNKIRQMMTLQQLKKISQVDVSEHTSSKQTEELLEVKKTIDRMIAPDPSQRPSIELATSNFKQIQFTKPIDKKSIFKDNQRQFFNAVKLNNLPQVEKLLKENATYINVNALDEKGSSALSTAIEYGFTSMVEKLLKLEVNANESYQNQANTKGSFLFQILFHSKSGISAKDKISIAEQLIDRGGKIIFPKEPPRKLFNNKDFTTMMKNEKIRNSLAESPEYQKAVVVETKKFIDEINTFYKRTYDDKNKNPSIFQKYLKQILKNYAGNVNDEDTKSISNFLNLIHTLQKDCTSDQFKPKNEKKRSEDFEDIEKDIQNFSEIIEDYTKLIEISKQCLTDNNLMKQEVKAEGNKFQI